MVYDGSLRGKFVELKSATVEDAEFTLAIRQDPTITKYLPQLKITLEQQREWIKEQRKKEGDYFFVVWNKAGERLGTMGVYDVNQKLAEGGRLALYGEFHEKIEAGILMGDFDFDILNLDMVTGWVYEKNSSAIRWNRDFGAAIVKKRVDEAGESVVDIVTTKEKSRTARSKLRSLIYNL